MSHQLFAYASESAAGDDEVEAVAELERGAFNALSRTIYEVLGATEYDAGVSGNGGGRSFSQSDLEAALVRLPAGDQYEPEREFLRDCINNGAGGAWIGFY